MKAEIVGLVNQAVADALQTEDLVAAEQQFIQIREELGSNTKALNKLGVDGQKFFTDVWDQMDLSQYIKPEPKVVEMFEQLRDYRHFLLSNSNRLDQMERKLGLVGLSLDVFELIVETTVLGLSKPDQAVYQYALDKLQVSPSQILYVGDREETDIVGAKRVGMRTCLIGSESDLADLCLATPHQLVEVFWLGKI